MARGTRVSRKGRAFYGWIALAGATLVYFTGSGTFFYSYGVFLPTMCQELGWSRAAMGAGLSVGLLTFGLPSPIIGASIARFGPRANVMFGNLLAAVGLAAMSLAKEIGHLYFFYGVLVGLGAGFGMYMACTTVVNNWFIRRRSLGMGLVIAAGGLGGFAFPPFVTWLIAMIGWQMSWVTLAGIHFAGAVLIGGLILIRSGPEAMGQAPDGLSAGLAHGGEEEAGRLSAVYQSPVDWPTKQAMRKRATWLIATLGAANFLALGTITAHQVAYLEEIGFSPMVAATAFSMVPAMSIVGRLGFGVLAVRVEVRHLAMACCLAQVMALAILLTTKSLALIYLYAVFFGISYGGLVVALPTFIGAYYGRAHYAQILGIIFPLAIAAEAVGPVLAGGIFDATGTYLPAFAILVASSSVGLACAILARPPKLFQQA